MEEPYPMAWWEVVLSAVVVFLLAIVLFQFVQGLL